MDTTNSSVATLSCNFSCEKPFLNLYRRAVINYKYLRWCGIWTIYCPFSFLNRSCIRFFRDIVCTQLQIAITSMLLEHPTQPESPGLTLSIVLINLVLAPFIYGTLSKQNQSIASLLIRRISDVWHLYLHHASVFQERPTQFPIGEMSFSKECVFVHRL